MKEEIPIEDVRNDSDSALSSVPNHMDFSNQEPGLSTWHIQRTPISCFLYPRQIIYGSWPLPKAIDTQTKSTGS